MNRSLMKALNITPLEDPSVPILERRQEEILYPLYQDLELIYVEDDMYGDIIKCKHRFTKEKVAIKIITIPDKQKKDGVPSSVIRQVSILKALDHPNIVRLMYVVGTEDDVYLSFEQLETNLHRYLCNRLLFSRPKELKFVLQQILSGVAYCHNQKVLHRDLRPQNILIQTHQYAGVFPEKVKLTGFGAASTFELPHSSSYSADMGGNPCYRAPEHLLGSTNYSPASDIWSLGCIFAEMFIRKPLFNGDDQFWILAQIFRLLGAPTQQTWPGLSKVCNFVVALDPTMKPKSLAEEFGNLEPAGVDLLSEMLCMCPERRISAEKALAHPYFR